MRWRWTWIVVAMVAGVSALAGAGDDDVYPATLEAGSRSARLGARFQPMSAMVELSPATQGPKGGTDHRAGLLPFGPPGGDPRRVVVSRGKPGGGYNLLLVDTDGDGSLDDETVVEGRLQSNGQTRWSTFLIQVAVDHGTQGHPDVAQHPFRVWLTLQGEDATPTTIQYMSQGWMRGRVEIEGRAYDIVLADRSNDAWYGTGDAWTIHAVDEGGRAEAGDGVTVGDTVDAGGRTWQLVIDSTSGKYVRVAVAGAKIGAAPDRKAAPKQDAHAGDRASPRAESPLTFAEDFAAARKEAAKIQGPIFVFVGSQTSAASRDMEQIVFAAKAVVGAAAGLTCVKIDADASPEQKKIFNADKLPTGVLLDPMGEEVARFDGYQGVQDFRAFISEVHPWLRPGDDEYKPRSKARRRHRKEIKRCLDYLEDNSHQGLVVDRIKDLGTRKNRAARDALMQFAATRKSKEYIAAAFFALADIGGRDAMQFLCGSKALGSKDFLVAQQAAEALAKAKDPTAINALLEVLDKRGTKIEVVSACCLALAQSAPKNERVIKAVFERSGDGKDTIRAGATEALGYLRSDDAMARLREALLEDKNTRVRAAAATGIGHSGRVEAIPLLRQAIDQDKAHTVRTAALAAIQKLQQGDK